MPNTTLPTPPTPGGGSIISDLGSAYEEINRMSRDTGWRNLTSLLVGGWVADSVHIRRIDSLVILEITNLDPTAMTSGAFLKFSASSASNRVDSRFLPAGDRFRTPRFESTNAAWGVTLYQTALDLNVQFDDRGSEPTGQHTLQISWHTFRGWPVFLAPEV